MEQDRLLRLHAELKAPGRAWFQFEVEGNGAQSTLRQTVIFDPIGVLGLLYWYSMYPLHTMVFKATLNGVVESIENKVHT